LHDYPGIWKSLREEKDRRKNSYDVHEYIIKLINEGYIKQDFGEVAA